MIRTIGKTERRVIVALLVTAVVPLLTAMLLANEIIQRISSTAFQPEFGQHMDRSLGVYADLVSNMKRAMRAETEAMAANPELRAAASDEGREESSVLEKPLRALLAAHPQVLSVQVMDVDGESLALLRRALPIDEVTQRAFTVHKPLAQDDEGATLTVVYAADKRRLDEMAEAQTFAQAYRRLERVHRDEYLNRPYITVFALLLCVTVVLGVGVGVMVVRPATRRINELAAATRPVAEGDLSVRVDERGRDEVADLARAFNHMLETLGDSRARIEFLKRVGEWQTMARRLAHEIKNPLTPIQLAVQECHRRYDGDSKGYKRLLQTTLDIVVEEVQSLRRLVGEFAEFARLPRANLVEGDLSRFMRQQQPRIERDANNDAEDGVQLEMALDEERIPVALDRTMLYRVVSNLITNARQAAAAAHPDGGGKVSVRTSRTLQQCHLTVEDNGDGVPPDLRPTIFDPYVTTKAEGTGLGLTICKKIIIDHGGHIIVDDATLGGARFRITLPLLGTRSSEAALVQSERYPLSGPHS